MVRNYFICGASSGLGLALAERLPVAGDNVWLTSRRRPSCLDLADGVNRSWLPADLARPEAVDDVCAALAGIPLDGLIYSAATWESDDDLTAVTTDEIYNILAVNVAAFIAITRGLMDGLSRSGNARVIAIGSIAGLENVAVDRVVYSASKFALRGAVNGFREQFRGQPVGFTVISPGPMASDIPLASGVEAALRHHKKKRIPLEDVIGVIQTIFELTVAATVKEIQMLAAMNSDW